MRYLSVCSGIEAASVAWHPLGWEPVAFSEIEPFPCAVLAHHYPAVPNLGDMTAFKEWRIDGSIDLLVGGTPCQSFSVAGLRKGLDDPRGNLMLVYLAIARRFAPRWVVWENVPGVLSSHGGRDFGTFLGGLAECGYGFAYRVLDAQFFGVPQRRRRVFVVGHLGDWRPAAAVLLERESLRGYPPPSREEGERVAPTVSQGPPFSRTGNERVEAEAIIPTITKSYHKGPRFNGQDDGIVVAFAQNQQQEVRTLEKAGALAGIRRGDAKNETLIAHALRADGFDASEDGTGRGTPLVVGAVTANGDAHSGYKDERGLVAETLRGHPRPGSNALGALTVANTLTSQKGRGRADNAEGNYQPVGSSVRRLTPRECERLQGFPDDYTAIPYRGKPAADGPRYKALGNSMAVPVMRWIGERIQAVTAIQEAREDL